MDDQYSPRPIAGWFTPAAIASLLFMGLGCIMYLTNVFTDPNALPLDERAAYLATPDWVTAAFAVAVWAGLGGAILLVMKKKLAEYVLGFSLLAVLVWFAGLLIVAPLRDSMSANDLIVALVITALTWTVFWFARHSRQRGWLR